VNEKFETHEHDVLIIGAGGAGLRAAIEALGHGASVAVVCKSLLGKAHTVMAEGGIAAAMANVDAADDWRTHFRDTMRGGKFLNNWRMAQIHAQEAPDRVRELEQWGALFDRTSSGDILQRAFGGHTFKRLCHVGDRTGLVDADLGPQRIDARDGHRINTPRLERGLPAVEQRVGLRVSPRADRRLPLPRDLHGNDHGRPGTGGRGGDATMSGGDPRVQNLAKILVGYSTQVKEDDVVAIDGETAASPLLLAVYEEVLKAGGHPMLNVALEGQIAAYFKHASDRQLEWISPFAEWMVDNADVRIAIGATTNTRELRVMSRR